MEIKFFSRSIFKASDVLKVVKNKKKPYLYRAGKYLLKAARNRVVEHRADSDLEEFTFTNSFGREQTETFWNKSRKNHAPYDHLGWKNSIRFGVDESAEVVDIGAINGRKHIPPLPEFGETGILEWTEFDKRGNEHKMSRRYKYPKRPTMIPALQKSVKYISSFWKDVVTNY